MGSCGTWAEICWCVSSPDTPSAPKRKAATIPPGTWNDTSFLAAVTSGLSCGQRYWIIRTRPSIQQPDSLWLAGLGEIAERFHRGPLENRAAKGMGPSQASGKAITLSVANVGAETVVRGDEGGKPTFASLSI